MNHLEKYYQTQIEIVSSRLYIDLEIQKFNNIYIVFLSILLTTSQLHFNLLQKVSLTLLSWITKWQPLL